MRAGQRIGNWFLWLDIDSVLVSGDRCVVVTARDAVTGGDIVNREFASREMSKALRAVADNIDKALGETQ